MTYEFLQSLYSDLKLMLANIVIKRADLARDEETADTARAFELYYACLTGSRYFYNFKQYDADILGKYLSPAEVSECMQDITLIPENIRDSVVEDQSQRTITNYVEQNEYYRMVNGQPRLDDHQWIYVTDVTGIPTTTPIHQLSDEQIAQLDISGKLATIQEDNPTAYYLHYLGVYRISIVDARLAKPFEILRLGTPANMNTQKMFEGEYYKARRYVMATMYNRKFFASKTLYDPIVGVIMLTLAARNTLVPNEAEYLNFDEILNAILESYGLLSYFKNFPFTFKRRLVLALDKILQTKGTDGVLVDICKIFSFDNFTAKRYYLMKTQPKDVDGNVIFSDDPAVANALSFVKASIEDHEIDYSPGTITPYDTVVTNDYLWQLSEEEKTSLLTEDFNLMMTKYIDIEAAYDLSSLTFEVCYFINMLLQSRDNEIKISCTNMYATGGSSNIYTMILFLLTALAKRANFDGNIIYGPDEIAQCLRFNEDDIEDAIKEISDKYELEIDVNDTLLSDYESPLELSMPIGNETDQTMLNKYIYNRDLYNAILEELHTTTDIRKYIALSNAKDCMYISNMEYNDFKKSDGTHATTYAEMLADLDPKLAAKLDAIDPDKDSNELDKILLYMLEKLEDLFSSTELQYLFLNTPNTYGTLIAKYLKMAINVFKASSVQLESINVFFNIGDSDPIRIIDQNSKHSVRNVDDKIRTSDEIATHRIVTIDDTINMIDKPYSVE